MRLEYVIDGRSQLRLRFPYMVRLKEFYGCNLGSQSADLKLIKRKNALGGPDIRG